VSVLFITGAGTDIGKTYVTAALVRRLRASGRPVLALKPLASGVAPVGDPAFEASDPAVLLRAQGQEIDLQTVADCSPWRFTAPLSPDMAAAAEGRGMKLGEVVDWTLGAIARAPADAAVLVEGVGGVMSPITEDAVVLDWIVALGAPALLVAGSHLGAISHALTAWTALVARGVETRAVLVNESEASTVPLLATAEAIARFATAVRVETLGRGEEIGAELANALFGLAPTGAVA
jgi:dethiobiotin synthetase